MIKKWEYKLVVVEALSIDSFNREIDNWANQGWEIDQLYLKTVLVGAETLIELPTVVLFKRSTPPPPTRKVTRLLAILFNIKV